VTLNWTDGPIGIYLNADKTGRIFPDGQQNVFRVGDLPEGGKEFYVEGVSPAAGQYLKANYASGGATC